MNYRTITSDELKIILAKHKEWLADPSKGERANLSSADLSHADLRYADLSHADLRYANLSYANLRYANLRYANLRYADLSYANLSYANLSSADLSHADLRYADLRDANLRYANLRYANLLIFQFQRHTAYFTLDGSLRIGCHVLPITEWLEGYREIGAKEGYSEAQIEAYGDFIRLCMKQFKLANPEASDE